MPEAIDTSATLTASGNFVHSAFGPASNQRQISSINAVEAGATTGIVFPATGQQWPLGITDGSILDTVIPESMIIVPSTGIYSQSSVYPGNTAADAISMTNGSISDTTKTATQNGGLQWIKIDYGTTKIIKRIYLGDYTPLLVNGWGYTGEYLSGVEIEISSNNSDWVKLFRVQNSSNSVLSYPNYSFTPNLGVFSINLVAPVQARYIRMINAATLSGWIACTEFYATSI